MERVTENMKTISQPVHYLNGVRRHERGRIQELADQGLSPQEISDAMRVKLHVIEAFLGTKKEEPVAAPAPRKRKSRAKG